MIFLGHFYRIAALVLVMAARHPKKLSPVIDFSRAICMHRTVNHHCGYSVAMNIGDFANVTCIIGICKTLIVYHHVKPVGPIGFLIQFDLCSRPLAPLEDNRPLNIDSLLFSSQLHRFGLVVVIVTTSTCDNQHFNRLSP